VIEVRKNGRLDVELCLVYFVVIVEFVREEQPHEHELHHAVIVMSLENPRHGEIYCALFEFDTTFPQLPFILIVLVLVFIPPTGTCQGPRVPLSKADIPPHVPA
jgi:hypothetical protein